VRWNEQIERIVRWLRIRWLTLSEFRLLLSGFASAFLLCGFLPLVLYSTAFPSFSLKLWGMLVCLSGSSSLGLRRRRSVFGQSAADLASLPPRVLGGDRPVLARTSHTTYLVNRIRVPAISSPPSVPAKRRGTKAYVSRGRWHISCSVTVLARIDLLPGREL